MGDKIKTKVMRIQLKATNRLQFCTCKMQIPVDISYSFTKCVIITRLHRLVESQIGGVLWQRRPPVELHLELFSIFWMYQLHHTLVYNVRLHTTRNTSTNVLQMIRNWRACCRRAVDVSFSLTRWQHSNFLREKTSWPPF